MPAPSMWSMRVIEQFSIVKASAASGSRPSASASAARIVPAMRDGDDVAPGICLDQLMDGARHPLDDGEKALTAWNHLMCRRMPEAMKFAGAALVQLLVGETLPYAKVLLREIVDHECLRSGDAFGSR